MTDPDVEDSGVSPATGDHLAATDGRQPGRRGLATRMRLLDSTKELLRTTPWRSVTVIDVARAAGTSPATFYQYFENFEQAILVLAEELVDGAAAVADLVDGDWSEEAGWDTARRLVIGFMDYWERNRPLFRVVDLATEEGDLRFQGLRVRALNALTVSLAKAITLVRATQPFSTDGVTNGFSGNDPMAVAATLVSMLAHVAAHRYGYEFWGIRTDSMSDVEARLVYWAVTGRSVDCDPEDLAHLPAPRTGAVLGGGAARASVQAAHRLGRSTT
ncbi:MAG: TetR family transcriptional regulator [Acidimicrobiales bacterium]